MSDDGSEDYVEKPKVKREQSEKQKEAFKKLLKEEIREANGTDFLYLEDLDDILIENILKQR